MGRGRGVTEANAYERMVLVAFGKVEPAIARLAYPGAIALALLKTNTLSTSYSVPRDQS